MINRKGCIAFSVLALTLAHCSSSSSSSSDSGSQVASCSKPGAATPGPADSHCASGGPDGGGWPFGRPVQVGEVYAVLQGVRGLELVEDVRLFGADPITGQRGQAVTRLDLDPNALVFSYEHQLLVEGA